jgi:flavin reductase (DIM6/NTAB) family NADH-FMN oxidoreductase RutF
VPAGLRQTLRQKYLTDFEELMHYDPRHGNGGLAHDPLTALIVPRPIGWISTISPSGTLNLAPYSFFNAVAGNPPFLMFASGGLKHSQHNADRSGEFVHSLTTWDLREEMNLTSAAVGPEVSEPELAKLEMAPSTVVKPPRVKRSPVAFECKFVKSVDLPGHDGKPHIFEIVIGEVVSIYIDDAVIVEGAIDLSGRRPIARLGSTDQYTVVDTIFRMSRPR